MTDTTQHWTGRSLLGRVARRPGRPGSALRLAIVALAVDGGGMARAADAADVADPDRARFEDWAGRAAMRLGGEVSMLTEVELDGSPGGELVARLCHEDGWAETVLVDDGSHRWSVVHPSWGHTPVCEAPGSTSSWGGADELRLVDWGPGLGAERRLAIIDAELVVLGEWHADHEVITEARWDLASHHRDASRGRVVAVRQENAVQPEPGLTFFPDGKRGYGGAADAELRAVAERRPDGRVLLRVTLTDDEPRLGAAGDGVDIWWRHGSTDELSGVRVRSDEAGRLRVAAVRYDGEPEVHGEVHGFELVLPWTVALGERFVQPLTIVARDVDDDGTTRVATSQFDGTTRSLGLLRWVPGGGDYEPIGERIADASAFDALPIPPTR